MHKNAFLLWLLFFSTIANAQYSVGNTYYGYNNTVQYVYGNLPIIISAPHGGTTSAGLPDRTCAGITTTTDSNTDLLAIALKKALANLLGKTPHTVICNVLRSKIDVNRTVSEATCDNATAAFTWNDYHNFIGAAKTRILQTYGKGILIDIHGHGHTVQKMELGYNLSTAELSGTDTYINGSSKVAGSTIRNLVGTNLNGLSHAALVRGAFALGTYLETAGYPSVPSSTNLNPGTDDYFSGGYTVEKWGSKDGDALDAIQIECNYDGVRNSTANINRFADSLAHAIKYYVEKHYFTTLSEQISSVASGNWSNPATWSNNSVPSALDNVLIAPGHVVAVDDANAVCNSISFGDVAAKLNLSTSTSVLSVSGNFSLAGTAHSAFSGWTAGACIKFNGAGLQTISGFATSGFSTSFDSILVDKPVGDKLVTSGGGMVLGLGKGVEVLSGTFELSSTDDIEGRLYTGTANSPLIVVRQNGTFNMAGSTSHIRRASNTGDNTMKIGKLTVFGLAYLAAGDSKKASFDGIDVENGGIVEMSTSRSTSTSGYFNPGLITVKNGGKFKNSLATTTFWFNNVTTPTVVTVASGGEYEVGASSTILPQGGITQNTGSMFRFSSDLATTLPAGITNYKTLILSGLGSKTLATNITVEEALQLSGSFTTLFLGSSTLTYSSNSVLRYGASGQSTPQNVTAIEWPASNGPNNVQIYNSGGVTLGLARTIPSAGTLTLTYGSLSHSGNLTLASGATISRARGTLASAPNFGAITNILYNSSIAKVATDLEVPAGGILNNLTISTALGITVSTPLTVNGLLNLNNGIADLGANNLIAGSVAGGSASSFINTNGAGLFTVKNIGVASTTLPVGYNTYSPVIVSNSGTTDDFSVNVAPGTICNAAALSSVNRIWTLTEALAGGSNVSVGLRWSAYLEGASFVRNSSAAVHCSGGVVDLKGSIGTAAVTDTFFTQTITGINNFSPFGVTSDAATLPVHILNLSGKKLAFSNWLFWDASGEVNSSHYEVERSQSGNSFVTIGKILAKSDSYSNNKKYQFEDNNPLDGIQYYRIKEVGNDLSLQYSAIIALQPNNKQSRFQVYPNPVEGRIIHLAIETAEPGIYHVGIYSLQGQLLQQKQLAVPIRNSLHHIELQPQVMPGMYQFIITDAKGIIVSKQLIYKNL
jgi:N-formylglutamate amidohydrolase